MENSLRLIKVFLMIIDSIFLYYAGVAELADALP